MIEDPKARKREIETGLMDMFLERQEYGVNFWPLIDLGLTLADLCKGLQGTLKNRKKEGSRMNYTTKTVRILPKAADLPNYKLDTTDESDDEPTADRNSPLLKSTAGAGNVPSGVYNNISLMEMLTKSRFENDNILKWFSQGDF